MGHAGAQGQPDSRRQQGSVLKSKSPPNARLINPRQRSAPGKGMPAFTMPAQRCSSSRLPPTRSAHCRQAGARLASLAAGTWRHHRGGCGHAAMPHLLRLLALHPQVRQVLHRLMLADVGHAKHGGRPRLRRVVPCACAPIKGRARGRAEPPAQTLLACERTPGHLRTYQLLHSVPRVCHKDDHHRAVLRTPRQGGCSKAATAASLAGPAGQHIPAAPPRLRSPGPSRVRTRAWPPAPAPPPRCWPAGPRCRSPARRGGLQAQVGSRGRKGRVVGGVCGRDTTSLRQPARGRAPV